MSDHDDSGGWFMPFSAGLMHISAEPVAMAVGTARRWYDGVVEGLQGQAARQSDFGFGRIEMTSVGAVLTAKMS